MEHELDDVIPQAVPKSYFKAAKHGKYIVIKGLTHTFKHYAKPQKYIEIIEKHVAEIISEVTA